MLDDSIINEAIGRVVVISKLMDICSKGCCMLVIATLNDDHVKQAVVERIIPDIPTDTLVLICMPDAGNTNFINSLVVNIGSQAARVMGLGVTCANYFFLIILRFGPQLFVVIRLTLQLVLPQKFPLYILLQIYSLPWEKQCN